MSNSVRISVTAKGDFDPPKLFDAFKKGVRKRLPKMMASDFHQSLVTAIESNKYGFILSEAWLGEKRRKGYDSRPFIATGDYLDSLSIVYTEGHMSVGFKSGTRKKNQELGNIAVILEYGNSLTNLPARPLWRFTIRDFFKIMPKRLTKQLTEILKDEGVFVKTTIRMK